MLCMDIRATKETAVTAMTKIAQVLQNLEDGKSYIITIAEDKQKRSRSANNYAWQLLDKLAVKLRKPKTEIYKDMIKEIGGNNEVVCVQNMAVERLINGWKHNGIGWVAETEESKIDGCTRVVLYYGSSTYNTEQMSRLIDLIVQECKQCGIETETQQEISLLLKGE